ncbi:MAG: preprotein translocase subunit SecG [Candidatus Symbiothrix sp.]|jgi:preprotein translocase subunit SecG|nr:preprotein translocase subunit SecG [Candidatus Symbiothrix sp.]
MYIFISILIVIASLFLILIVVIQNSKGGGLAAGFASSNQVMGVRKTTDFLEKATWWLAGIVVVLSVFATVFLPRHASSSDSIIKEEINESIPAQDANAVAPFGSPILEEPAPAEPAPAE